VGATKIATTAARDERGLRRTHHAMARSAESHPRGSAVLLNPRAPARFTERHAESVVY
jgi:hypothetical protein